MSSRHWTPYQIEIVLHHAHSFAKFERWTAPLYEPTLADLCERGVLKAFAEPRNEHDESRIGATDLGMALVEMWLQTPLPRAVIIDPRDGKQVMVENHRPPETIRDILDKAGAADLDVIVDKVGPVNRYPDDDKTYPMARSTEGHRSPIASLGTHPFPKGYPRRLVDDGTVTRPMTAEEWQAQGVDPTETGP